MKQGRTVVAALAAVMAVVLWYMFLFGPQRAERRRLADHVTVAEAQEQELRSTLARLQRVAAEQEAHEAQLERFKRLVPAEADVAGFILAANDAAVRSGVDWVSVAPAAAAAGTSGAPSALPVSIAVNGDFFTVVDYLRRLENLERLVVVDSLQLSPDASGGGAVQLTATMSARMFTAAPAAPGPGSPGADAAPTPAPVGAAGG